MPSNQRSFDARERRRPCGCCNETVAQNVADALTQASADGRLALTARRVVSARSPLIADTAKQRAKSIGPFELHARRGYCGAPQSEIGAAHGGAKTWVKLINATAAGAPQAAACVHAPLAAIARVSRSYVHRRVCSHSVIRLGAAATAGLAAALALIGCEHPAAKSSPPTPSVTVTSASPQRAVWPVTLEAPGPIAAWQEASVGTQIGSYQLIEVRVNVGDEVHRGEVLARLNPALLEADEAQLKATYDQAEANRRRSLELQSSGAISDQDVLNDVTTAKTAAANLAAKRLQLKYTRVVALDDGVISARTATLGAVEPAGQELFKVILKGRLEWRGEVTAVQLLQVKPGQPVVLTLPDGSEESATVRETAPSLDPNSRLGTVYADITPHGRARAGMYANAHIALGQSQALVVPAASVVIRDGRSCVLKLLDGSATPKVVIQTVTIGRRSDRDVEVLSGLALVDRVVVQGAGFLNDGDVVRLADSAAGAATDGG